VLGGDSPLGSAGGEIRELTRSDEPLVDAELTIERNHRVLEVTAEREVESPIDLEINADERGVMSRWARLPEHLTDQNRR
jgi:hypothetical protein